ncbi:MAG TPA: F0F1 ATP synthase subunit delta [Candidatus Saccharimonadales bacterium]|nr:F0F1 ATP synthase subunit delta [Candidatus Saccharimonadales bacterium]
MQNNQIYSEISESLITKSDYESLQGELDVLEESLYKRGDSGFNKTLKDDVRGETADLILQLGQHEDLKTLLENLKKYLTTETKFLNITLAIDPPKRVVNEIGQFTKSISGKNVCIDIQVDEKILGGATFDLGGKFVDFSVAKKLEEVLKNENL